MQIYLVGGAVRDALMGLPTADRDWVVVGSTPSAMLARGFLPVGADFPVFLHPQTHEEYALARTERKTAPGYTGFAIHSAPDVTLEDDLARRDLTINSIAARAGNSGLAGTFDAKISLENGSKGDFEGTGQPALIDPYGGQRDIAGKVLRHVTDAFREDPVRILRVARFAARFAGFTVAGETQALMQHMVTAGEADALVPERVWLEISRGLMAEQPSRMLEVLRDCGALAVLLPEVNALWGVPQTALYHPEIDTGVHLLMVLDMAARLQAPLSVRFACLCHDLGKGTTPAEVLPRHIGHEMRSAKLLKALCQRWRIPSDCRELAEVVAMEHGNIHRSSELNAAATLRLLERCDAFRRPARFADALLACECDARGRLGFAEAAYPQRPALMQALAAAQAVDTEAVAQQATAEGLAGAKIGERIQAARTAALRTAGFA